MLEVLRKKGVNKTILWFIAIIIILSFGVFGTAYRVDSANSPGTIFGHTVSAKDFSQALDDARDQAVMSYGPEYYKNRNRIDLEQIAWDRLMLLHEAKNRSLTVSDQEVVDFIATLPFFQSKGQFDQVRYEETVQSPEGFDRPTHDFEEGVRKQLIIRKLIDSIAPDSVINDTELKKEYQKRNEKLTLEYVLFNAADYAKKVSAGDEEIKSYYEAHKDEFRTPPTIVLNYVQTKDKATADTLSKELAPGSDFAAVAKSLKLEMKTSSPMTQEAPILTFASNPDNIAKFFQMKPGTYSSPLEAPDGWQIVQLKAKNESTIPPIQDIKDKVRDAVAMQKGFALAKPEADKVLKGLSDALKANKDFKTAAAELKLKVEETPAFGRKEYIAHTGLIQEFQQEADQLNSDKRLSGVVSTSQGPAIIYLEKQEKPSDAEFDSDKENFKQMLGAERRNQVLINFMNQLRAQADVHSRIKHQ